VTYDEHGGFFDHAAPPSVSTTINGVSLPTTGPRVPALLISPWVAQHQVFSETLDHTSILQLLADRFTSDRKYSDLVTARQQHFGRIARALSAQPRADIPRAPRAASVTMAAATAPTAASAPPTANAAALDAAARDMAREHPEWMGSPEWRQMREYLETNPPPVPVHHERIN
jgi:phospholipase C